MRAKISQNYLTGMYYGEIYDEWKQRWEQVTTFCFTRWGTKRLLKKYKKRQESEEFEL